MKTRTLMLLALGCGLMIMIAGAVFLFQLTRQDDVPAPIAIGERADVGDMAVVVESAAEDDGVLVVVVSIGGVDDADGLAGFRLIASGRTVERITDGSSTCAGTTVEVRSCTIRFDVASADGSSRVLFYERGDDTARWVVA